MLILTLKYCIRHIIYDAIDALVNKVLNVYGHRFT